MLQKHKNGTYYFRYIIPKDLQDIFNTKEILKSLKTKNKKVVDVLYNDKVKELEQIIYYIRTKVLSEKEINLMIDDFKKNEVTRVNTLYTETPNPESLYDFDDFEENIKIYKGYIQEKDYSYIDETIQELLKKFNIDNYTEEQYNELGRQVCLSYCGLNEYIDNLIQGKVRLDDKYNMLQFTSKTIVENFKTFNNVQKTNIVGVTLGEYWDKLFEYLINIKKLSESSLKGYRSSKKYLNLFYNDDTDVGVFTKKIFRDLQVTYTKLPIKTCSNKKYENMTIKELTELDVDKLNNKTINVQFSYYKVLFQELVYDEITHENIVSVKKLPEQDSNKERYSDKDLEKIFTSELDTKYKNLCKISLYTGMRYSEILFLKTQGIVNVNGVDCIEIKEGDTSTKTKNSVRTIPIHNEIKTLIKNSQKTTTNNYLFYNGNNTDEEVFGTVENKNINKELNKIIIDKNKTFHSFRKNFITKLYETSPTQESFIKVLSGHSIKNNITLSVYGNVNINELFKMVEKVEFDINY